MMEDVPGWAFAITHALIGLGSGIGGAWITSRASNVKARADQTRAETERESSHFEQMRELLREEREARQTAVAELSARLEQEQRDCDEKLAEIGRELSETRETVRMLVHRLEDISDPYLEEIGL